MATATFGTLFAFGLTITYGDPLLIPWALVLAGGGSLLLAKSRGLASMRTLFLLTLALLIATRLVAVYSLRGAALLLLALMEGYGALVIGRLRGVMEGYVTEQERGRVVEPIRWGAMAGALVGSGVGIVAALLIPEPLFFWFLGGALLIGFALTYLFTSAPLPEPKEGIGSEIGVWQRLAMEHPFLQWLLAATCGVYLIRATTVAQTLEAYALLLSGTAEGLVLFFALLFTASALLLGVAYALFRPLRRRLGPLALYLIYPTITFALLLTWTLLPSALTPPILVSFGYLALLPALFLPEVESGLSLFPGRFARSLGRLTFAFAPPLSLLVGGLLWALANRLLPMENRLILLTLFSLGLIGAAVGAGLYYRRSLVRYYAGTPTRQVELPKLSRSEIHNLLASSDPLLQELALKNGAHLKSHLFGPDLIPLLAAPPPKPVLEAAYAYLAAAPEALLPLLDSSEAGARMRGALAALNGRLPVDSRRLNALMDDPDPTVQMAGCALGWQRGRGEAAGSLWEGISLPNLPSSALVELIEAIPQKAPSPLIRLVKKLAWYPSSQVRQAAVRRLGLLLVGESDDPNLLEVALAGIASEEPTVRARALSLLLAAGGDNAAVHAAALLADPDPAVRSAAATTLAKAGGLDLAAQQLHSADPATLEAAIWALAQSGSRGEERLLAFLKTLPPSTPRFIRFPPDAPINIALQNRADRAIAFTATALEAIGEGEAAQLLRYKRDEPGAFELLSRLAPSAYLDPLRPLLREPPRERRTDEQALKELQQLAHNGDPFIRIGAQLALDPNREDPFMNRLLFLKKTPYFEGLLLEELALLDQRLTQEEFLKGETIFAEGSEGDRFYLVYEGRVALTHGMRPLTELREGEGFGEMALFEEESRSATATAATDTLLLSLDRAHFHELMLQRPTILLQICRQLSHRLREMDKRFALISA
ncbi:MAG: cyclic nucleotide-binding domain-containing protein [Parachlamydiales bacterium]